MEASSVRVWMTSANKKNRLCFACLFEQILFPGMTCDFFKKIQTDMEIEGDSTSPVSREEWRLTMRKAFCKKDMIDEDGNLIKE